MYKLRDYQEKGLKACMEVMQAKKKKAIVVQPTGAGKSLLIAKTVKELNLPIVILQPSKELLIQNYLKYIDFGGEATIYCASLKEKTKDKKDYTKINGEEKRCDEISNVTFATVGSIKKEVQHLKNIGVKHLIIDEIHLGSKAGSQIRGFIKTLNITNVLGLTATPIYLKGGMEGSRLVMINRTFGTMFRTIQQVTQISELVEKGYWTPLNYRIIQSDESKLKLNTSGSDYSEHSQKEYYKANNLNDQIVEEVDRLKEEGRKRILIFVPSIEEAQNLHASIPNSAVVHSKMKRAKRDFMVRSFSSGERPVAINVNVLATGYDNPQIDAIISARPTSSVTISYQQYGRGVRLHKDKKDCRITDFSGNVERFGRIEDLHFEDLKGYGWGMFNGKDEILTDFPIQVSPKPTKKSLTDKAQQEVDDFLESSNDPEIFFGKHKGKKVSEIYNNDKDKGYLFWLVKEDFLKDWGAKGVALQTAIYKKLRIPVN